MRKRPCFRAFEATEQIARARRMELHSVVVTADFLGRRNRAMEGMNRYRPGRRFFFRQHYLVNRSP
jgi:hypothetical protein